MDISQLFLSLSDDAYNNIQEIHGGDYEGNDYIDFANGIRFTVQNHTEVVISNSTTEQELDLTTLEGITIRDLESLDQESALVLAEEISQVVLIN